MTIERLGHRIFRLSAVNAVLLQELPAIDAEIVIETLQPQTVLLIKTILNIVADRGRRFFQDAGATRETAEIRGQQAITLPLGPLPPNDGRLGLSFEFSVLVKSFFPTRKDLLQAFFKH